MKKILLRADSPERTKRIGNILGRSFLPGTVVALQGELGAGKTTMAKGIAKGLGVASERTVSSPTFVLIHEYSGRKKVYHLDWYRLPRVEGADEAMAEECFASGGVTLVEWPERGRALLPSGTVFIRLSHRGPKSRMISLLFPSAPSPELLRTLKKP
jgi:tRNA threonylcarbamoyladenosine biosynthesis protein TsaE